MLLRTTTPKNRHQIATAVVAAAIALWLLAIPGLIASLNTQITARDATDDKLASI